MEDKPIINIKSGIASYLIRHPIWVIAPFGIFVALSWMIIFLVPSGDPGNKIGVAVFLLFLAVATPISVAKNKVEDEFMRQFAEANNYQFSATGNSAEFDGSIFHQVGNSGKVTDVIRATYLGCPVVLLRYRFFREKATQEYIVLRLQFDTDMPDLFLQPAILPGNPFLSKTYNDGVEHVRLEGDFSKVFSLDIQKGYEVEALEVFAPNVMEYLINNCKNFSIEILNNHLYVYDGQALDTEAKLNALYDTSRYFVQTLGPVLARMKAAKDREDIVAN